ncbi:MAG: hypothetical protein QOJ74_1029 [Ilumatobacteraceae bacterium]|jgi:hypothetical protein|nr:hypothetical protein [Ilumatobacteraceae bacterium]
MPHFKSVVIATIDSANSKLRKPEPELIEGAKTLAELAARLELSVKDREAIDHLYPEIQDVILSAIKTAAGHGRPVYLSWRHSAVQRVEITAPPVSAPGEALDIQIESRYYDDGIG